MKYIKSFLLLSFIFFIGPFMVFSQNLMLGPDTPVQELSPSGGLQLQQYSAQEQTNFGGTLSNTSTGGTPKNFKDFINNKIINGILSPVIPLLIGLAVISFLYGVFKFVVSESDEKKQEGRDFMIWGIVGIFVMVSVWGLVGILSSTFKLDNSSIDVPSLSM